ncbi:MAG: hypothetical protein HC896_18735 [Bacteroidales bacterium]|nr:hypothetical protein [Bacteroidales bacterium]
MEYFVNLPTQGLIDCYGGISAKITPKLSAELIGHMFYFDKAFVYRNEKTDKNIGSEIDAVLNYTVSKEIAIQCGYSRYFNSGTTKKYFKMEGVDTRLQPWAYLMLTIRPQFYKTPPMPDSI